MNTRDNLLEKIKSKGYWYVNFAPVEFIPERIKNIIDCKQIIKENQVRFKGWSYPIFPPEVSDRYGINTGKNYQEGWVDVEGNKEIWRLYQSTQFVQYLALQEDWYAEHSLFPDYLTKIKPKTILGVTETLFTITEIFEFISKFYLKNVFSGELNVEITLFNILGRKLKSLDLNRAPLLSDYISSSNEIIFARKYSQESFLNSTSLSLEVAVYFFNRFSWDNPSLTILESDQKKLIQGHF
jgi:hypothetical protein